MRIVQVSSETIGEKHIIMDNDVLGCNCPCPDSGPDKNTETVGTTGDLNPMVYLSKLKKVQEHFGRQMLDVQFMLGRMETRAIRAETALADSENTLVGKMTEVEKIAEKAAKKNLTLVGIKKSVTIATGPDKVYIPTHLPSRNNSVDGERNLTVVGITKSVTIATGPDNVYIPTQLPSRNNDCDSGRSSTLYAARSINGPSGLSVSNLVSSPIVNNSLDTSGASMLVVNESRTPLWLHL